MNMFDFPHQPDCPGHGPTDTTIRGAGAACAYPDTDFGRGLELIARMIAGGLGASVYTFSLDGFDTHASQARTHARLLRELSEGLGALQSDLEFHGADREVLIFVFSEFGRSVVENAERGTDHGGAAPLFVLGTGVKGGIYGDHPSLTGLSGGDLEHKIDFRTIYATMLDRWLAADSREVLGARFGHLDFLPSDA
jgi:uncharacterized protein (DUF1501 family)